MGYDVIVLGAGGIGSAAVSALARRGAKTLGLDRFAPPHDRGSSHGRTRMIRQAYFEHPAYVPLVRRAYRLWFELEERRQVRLYRETGLVELGPPDGAVVPGVLASARQHGLEVEPLEGREVSARFPGLRADEPLVGVYEARAGCLAVEDCVRAHLDDAAAHGAEIRSGAIVRSWSRAGQGIDVQTDSETFHAARLVIAAGAWAAGVLASLGLRLTVRRKPQYWFAPRDDSYHVDRGAPAFLYELPEGVFYGFPQLDAWGVKMAQHSGGAVVSDPLEVDRQLDAADLAQVASFAAGWLPRVSDRLLDHAVCMYTLTPDEHFIVDRHPEVEQVVLAAGFSGHGFKFAPVLGEALAELALDGRTSLPIDFLGLNRPGLRAGSS